MVLEQSSSSPSHNRQRAARIATRVYLVICAIVLPLGVASGVLSEVVIQTAVDQPQGSKTAPFQQGTDTLYSSEGLLAWRRAAALYYVPGVFVLLGAGGITWWLRRAAARPAP